MSEIPSVRLNSGTSIPQIGLGVWQADDPDTERAVAYAIDEAGYTHIDTAAAYGNEAAVGRAVAAASVPRDQLFVTTKLWNSEQGHDAALRACDASLEALDLDYVDLYLVHWPLQDTELMKQTWEAMEEIASSGKAAAIGVCNFEPHHLDVVSAEADIVPAIDQVEAHPHLAQHDLRAFAADRGITVESWSPLGGTSNSGWGRASRTNTLLDDPILGGVAEKHDVSIAQVIVRWHLQNDLVVIPKSVNPERISANVNVFGFALDADDLIEIARLDTGRRVGTHPDEMTMDAPV